MPPSSARKRFLKGIHSRHTRRAYRTDLRDFYAHLEKSELHDGRIENVTKADIRNYVQSLRSDDLSVSTGKRRLSALRRFFDWAMDDGLADTNPARDVRMDDAWGPGETESATEAPSVLSKSEVVTLIRATSEAGEAATRDRGLFLTILYAALRRSEVASMDVEHVRPLGRHWVIDLSSHDTWSSAYAKIPETLVEAIDSVQARYHIDQGALWRSLSNQNRGARMTPDAIYKVVRRTGKRANLGRVTVETLRQTGLRLAMDAGASIRQVQLHARLQSASSVERLADDEGSTNRLGKSAVDFVNLDL